MGYFRNREGVAVADEADIVRVLRGHHLDRPAGDHHHQRALHVAVRPRHSLALEIPAAEPPGRILGHIHEGVLVGLGGDLHLDGVGSILGRRDGFVVGRGAEEGGAADLRQVDVAGQRIDRPRGRQRPGPPEHVLKALAIQDRGLRGNAVRVRLARRPRFAGFRIGEFVDVEVALGALGRNMQGRRERQAGLAAVLVGQIAGPFGVGARQVQRPVALGLGRAGADLSCDLGHGRRGQPRHQQSRDRCGSHS